MLRLDVSRLKVREMLEFGLILHRWSVKRSCQFLDCENAIDPQQCNPLKHPYEFSIHPVLEPVQRLVSILVPLEIRGSWGRRGLAFRQPKVVEARLEVIGVNLEDDAVSASGQ